MKKKHIEHRNLTTQINFQISLAKIYMEVNLHDLTLDYS